LPGFYERNQALWERLGQGGVPAHTQGLVHFSEQQNVFGASAGLASWVLSEHEWDRWTAPSPLSALKSSFALQHTPEALLICSRCAQKTIVEQMLCTLDEEQSGDCIEADGEVRLGGMALVDHVKCSWEFKYMQFIELVTVEFMPMTAQDVVEICHDGYDYKQCQNFTKLRPPPQRFYVTSPCKLTLYALSVFKMSGEDRKTWIETSAGINRSSHSPCPPSSSLSLSPHTLNKGTIVRKSGLAKLSVARGSLRRSSLCCRYLLLNALVKLVNSLRSREFFADIEPAVFQLQDTLPFTKADQLLIFVGGMLDRRLRSSSEI